MTTNRKPQIIHSEIVAKSRIFTVEQLKLRFTNGQEATFERMIGNEAVMVLPVTSNNEVLLVREYAAGLDSYEIGLLKGRIDEGESALKAAMREMQEEVGVAAKRLDYIRTFANAPHYSGARMHLYFAYDLFDSALPGDEVEPLEVCRVSITDIPTLFMHQEVNDARTLFALQIFLTQTQNNTD